MIHYKIHESATDLYPRPDKSSPHPPALVIKEPNILSIFPLLWSFQRIRPNPRPCMTFRDVLAIEARSYWPPTVGYSKLFLRYNRRYLRIWSPSPPSARRGTCQAVVARDPIKLLCSHFLFLICIDTEWCRKTQGHEPNKLLTENEKSVCMIWCSNSGGYGI
jgi:hypothetical protein